MNTKEDRYRELKDNLESVVTAAMAMKRADDMNERDYQVFNSKVWQLEQLAKEIAGDDE